VEVVENTPEEIRTLVFEMLGRLKGTWQPGPDDDQIAYEGVPYRSKVTIRYYDSSVFVRLLVVGLSLVVIWWMGREYLSAWKELWGKK